ncbi:MAG: hypothetical protein PUC12_17620 [Clostridiales bacterium]|nr:hypothetical protein [Clostridiales bacterium]
MNQIVLICFYFGKLPNYFQLWLDSAAKNPWIDFYFYTDNTEEYRYPSNVIKKSVSYEKMKKRIQDCFDFEVVIDRPYKMCDYRPAFGYILQEDIVQYPYWGTCDIDVILGNVSHFLNMEMICRYDKVLTLDHFVIYRNTPQVNKRFMDTLDNRADHYKEVFTDSRVHSFGERAPGGIYHIYKEHGWPMLDQEICADISYRWKHFVLGSDHEDHKHRPQVFVWDKDDGSLYRYAVLKGKVVCEEFMYMHLQKRKMDVSARLLQQSQSLLIVPNKILSLKEKRERIGKRMIIKYGHRRLIYGARIKMLWKKYVGK